MQNALKVLLGEAVMLAEHAHRKQLDKNGRPYIDHPLRVMEAAKTYPEKIVGVLHDVVEDCGVNVQYLRQAFGDEIADAVRAISKMPCEPLEQYYARVKANPLALAVKFLDIADNSDPKRLILLEESLRIRLALKYRKALECLS